MGMGEGCKSHQAYLSRARNWGVRFIVISNRLTKATFQGDFGATSRYLTLPYLFQWSALALFGSPNARYLVTLLIYRYHINDDC